MSDEGVADVSAADAIAATRANGRDEGLDCPHCEGTGQMPGGRRRLHCMGGFMGADWDVEDVVREIEGARQVAWVDHWNGHDLAVLTQEGRQWNFDVKRPEGVLPRGERAS